MLFGILELMSECVVVCRELKILEEAGIILRAEEFLQKGDKLYREDGALFFDYRVEDDKQLEREIRKNNRNAMFGALFCGVLLALGALFI